ncbi:MAG: cytochrome c3 family protein [Anaerolineales bacterium]|nr:cytochrome c3 family protein [Anaerolineales bacterium]
MREPLKRGGHPLGPGILAAGGLLAVLLWSMSAQSPAQAAAPPQAATPTEEGIAEEVPIESNQACLECHTQPDQTMMLANGETLYVTLDAAQFASSVHGAEAVVCRDCHTDITAYPHRPLEAQSLRQVTAANSQICQECHEGEAARQMDSIHAELRAEGNEDAAVCADCHNPHYQVKVEPRARIPVTCGRCHSGIEQEYRLSAHGAPVYTDEHADSPLCIDCHGVHTIQDPTTAQFLARSPQLCARCHADPERMAPYSLNTDVLTTYVADFHGTTTTLFARQTPDQLPNTPLCIDCHGIHNIQPVDSAESAVIKENLLATCQKCHPNASQNFSGAWLSHYTPSPEHNPLVYYVGLFYRMFVPVTVAGMSVYVASDIGRQLIRRRQAARRKGGK